MSRIPRTPSYCRQRRKKAADLAYVELGGRRFYLGEYNSPESHVEYARVVAEWQTQGGLLAPRVGDEARLTVVELLARFWRHAESYYVGHDGKPTSELGNLRLALRPVRRLYGDQFVDQFGPRALKAVRQDFIDRRCSRGYINRHINRIKLVFRWGVEEELVHSSVYEALRTVPALKRGRSKARETPGLKPVLEAHVNAIQPHVSRQVWAMVQLQLLTGARPGEILRLRAVDLDTSADVWVYRPERHKNAYRGHRREIYLGPRAQGIVKPFLDLGSVSEPMFSPQRAEEERRQSQRLRRMTPESCGNSVGTNRRRSPRRRPGTQYTRDSYRRAITRACDLAGIPHWTPHQLRHSAATELRKSFGIDVAQVVLGHRHAQITEVYAEIDRAKAVEAIRAQG